MNLETPVHEETGAQTPPMTRRIFGIRGCSLFAIASILAYAAHQYYFGPQPEAQNAQESRTDDLLQDLHNTPTGTVIFDMQDAGVQRLPIRLTHGKDPPVILRFSQSKKGNGLLLCLNEHGYAICNTDFLGNLLSPHVSTVQTEDDHLILGSRTRWYAHMRAHVHGSELMRVHREMLGKESRVTITVHCIVHGLERQPKLVLVPLVFERE